MNPALSTGGLGRCSQESLESTRARSRGSKAFTLVEILAAIAVLAIMVAMTASLMNNASTTVTASNKLLNANSQARMVFDRMQMDFATMVKRNDMYFNFSSQSGNDQFTFYSETPGFFDPSGSTAPSASTESNLSLVSYQILPQSTGPYELERLGQGCLWSQISFSPTAAPPAPAADDFHVLGSSVFRMDVAFLLGQGNNSFVITSTAPTAGTQPFQNFYAVIVALAVLDSDSQKLISPSAYPTLVAALPEFSGSQPISGAAAPSTAAVEPILSVWRAKINSANFAQSAGIPAAAASQVHIYQRMFYLK